MKGATMTIKEMCEYSNIEYNKDHPKGHLINYVKYMK